MDDAISLIVRGDDFGLCHAVNQAIWEAFETGILTCASVAVAGPWTAEAMALARDYLEWELGLELVLSCAASGCRWGPVAGPAAVPSLVDATGAFPPVLPATIDPQDVMRELAAQLARARAWGMTPAYLEYDGQGHPVVEDALHRLSEQVGIPGRMSGWGIETLPLAASAPPARTDVLLDAFKALTPGVYLWVAHPAQDSPETWGLWADEEMALSRHADLLALCDPEVVSLIAQRGIELISFRQHLESCLGTDAGE